MTRYGTGDGATCCSSDPNNCPGQGYHPHSPGRGELEISKFNEDATVMDILQENAIEVLIEVHPHFWMNSSVTEKKRDKDFQQN